MRHNWFEYCINKIVEAKESTLNYSKSLAYSPSHIKNYFFYQVIFLFMYFLCKEQKEKERQANKQIRELHHTRKACNNWDLLGLKSRVRNATQIAHVGSKDSATCSITHCSQDVHWQEARVRGHTGTQSQALRYGIRMNSLVPQPPGFLFNKALSATLRLLLCVLFYSHRAYLCTYTDCTQMNPQILKKKKIPRRLM